MPSCAGFEFVNQYLSIRDHMDSSDSQTWELDQKVPQYDFMPDSACMAPMPTDPKGPELVQIKSEPPYPLNFLNECAVDALPPGPFNTTAPTRVSPPPFTTKASPFGSSNAYEHQTSTARQDKSFTYSGTLTWSGCTVIEAPESTSADQQLPPGGSDSPDIYNLDQGTFYDDGSMLADKCSMGYDNGLKLQDCSFGMNGVMQQDAAVRRVMQDFPDQYSEIEQIIREIDEDCKRLSLQSAKPETWTMEEVQRWVELTCKKYGTSGQCKFFFDVNGATLCRLTENDFRQRSHEAGSFLYQQLQIFNMAADIEWSAKKQMTHPPAPSISPAPSLESTSSNTSSYSSSDDDLFTLTSSRKYPNLPVSASHRPPPPVPHHTGPRQPKQTIHLWQFLRELLDDPETYHNCIKWTDRNRGVFKIEDSSKVAKLWGRRKNRPAMNYDKLSRSVRQYYKKGIIKKTEQSKRLVYQFCTPYL